MANPTKRTNPQQSKRHATHESSNPSPAAVFVIQQVTIAANHPPAPEATLKTICRGTRILGKILEELTDAIPPAKPYAQAVSRLGLVAYGLFELSVPKSIWNLASRYWIKLLTLVGLIIFLIGLFLHNAATWKIGAVLLLGLGAIAWCIKTLSHLINRRSFSIFYGFRQLVFLVILLALCLLVVFRAGHIGELFAFLTAKLNWIEATRNSILSKL